MSRAARNRWLGCALALTLTGAAHADEWPDVALPDGSQGEWVSRHMIYNGLHMRAGKFSSTTSADDTLAFYRKAWRGDLTENRMRGKTVIGRPHGRHFVTVEIEPRGAGAGGTIGIMRLPEGPPEQPPGHGFARPAGSEVVNDIRYLDTRNETRTLLLTNTLSPFVNQQFYLRRLRSQGWDIVDPGGCKSSSQACTARFEKKNGARMSMSIRREREGGTVVVANLE